MLWGRLVVLSLFAVNVCLAKSKSYQHFEDYLNSLDAKDKAFISTGKDGVTEAPDASLEGSGDEDLHSEHFVKAKSSDEKSGLFAKPKHAKSGIVMDKDVACCVLGSMAGDKGYHCYAKFYIARILMRNKNRAHNRKMAFYGHEKIPNYGEKLMRTFEQCVAERSIIFHKCCHLAAMDRIRTPHYDSKQRKKYFRKHYTKSSD